MLPRSKGWNWMGKGSLCATVEFYVYLPRRENPPVSGVSLAAGSRTILSFPINPLSYYFYILFSTCFTYNHDVLIFGLLSYFAFSPLTQAFKSYTKFSIIIWYRCALDFFFFSIMPSDSAFSLIFVGNKMAQGQLSSLLCCAWLIAREPVFETGIFLTMNHQVLGFFL